MGSPTPTPKLPLTFDRDENNCGCTDVAGGVMNADGFCVATIWADDESLAPIAAEFGELVVKAVNSHDALLSALKRVLAGFEANAFQRNTDGDGDSCWAVKFLPHLMALADATRAIALAEGSTPDAPEAK